MNLPRVIIDLIEAQNSHDSAAYAECFSENSIMFDEGKTHTGKAEIQHLIEESNKKYKSVMKPLQYTEDGNSSLLSAECSGTFEGSPIVLQFHFEIVDGRIQHLKVTG